MRHDKSTDIKKALFLIGTILPLLLIFAVSDAPGNGPDELRKYLESRAQFDAADVSKMERGDMVSKLLPAKDKHEIAFCGIISINAPPEKGFELFQDRLSRLDKKSLIAFGTFSDPPVVADLEALTLEKGDIEALKKCRVGACGLKLSAGMIERFQKEVEWDGPDYQEQATALFRRLILEYVLDYRARGEAALIEYNNKPQPLSLRRENDVLLKELGWLENYAPDFSNYLQGRTAEPATIKKSIGWAKIKFGLKPVIIITEVITYSTRSEAGNDYLLSVSKQIYATHYVDSSLGLVAVVQNHRSETSESSYLLYVNHSRSSVLRGLLGKLTRKIVQHEVIEKLENLLEKTRSLADYGRAKQESVQPAPSIPRKILNWMSEHPYFIGFLILIVAFITINRFGKSVTKNYVNL